MRKTLLIVLLFALFPACSRRGVLISVYPHTPLRVAQVRAAVTLLESQAGCKVFYAVGRGSPVTPRAVYHPGVVDMFFVDELTMNAHLGYDSDPLPSGGRIGGNTWWVRHGGTARVMIRRDERHPVAIIVHELVHALGGRHVPGPWMMNPKISRGGDTLSTKTLRVVRRWCTRLL